MYKFNAIFSRGVSAEVVGDDVFGNPIEPGVKRRLAAVGLDATIRFQPRLLRQVFGDFGGSETFLDVPVETGLVFANQGRKGDLGVALLDAGNALLFVCRVLSFPYLF